MHVRRKLIAGNWKMNGSLGALAELAPIAAAARAAAGVDVVVCPPFTLIAAAAARGGGIAIGGQDCHWAESGAHTGSVSAAMLKEAGARLVITGHSERRAEAAEGDSVVRGKAERALAHGLQTIVCVGESDAERQAKRAVERVVEPIWAIGSGRTATPADVGEMHAAIRGALLDRFGDSGGRIRILYGGSVKAENAAELFAVPDVDGALVGGASLTEAQFVPIIEAAAAS